MCILTSPNILTTKEKVNQKLNLRRLLPCIENKMLLSTYLGNLPKYVVHFNVIVVNILIKLCNYKNATL